jgi:hypothetical protein
MRKIADRHPLSRLPLHAALVLAVAACGGPFLLIPGGELRGEVASEPVSDWSFADDQFVDLEVRPGDPYSVELNYFVRDGKLYIDPAQGRTWFEYLKEDSRVRVRFGDKIYPCEARLAGEPGELDGFDEDRFVYELVSRPAGS